MSKNKFQILSDREHIILRPQMYIGSTSPETITQVLNFKNQSINVVPGLLKIINEIIDNSVDEAIRTNFEYSNKIKVSIEKINDEWTVEVSDNGRGIPVVEYDGIYQAEASWTRAKAGTSFSDDRDTIGANGVGSFATNCFSKMFNGISCDGKRAVVVSCEDNCNPEKIHVTIKKSTKQGTTVTFIPDLDKFHIDEINEDHLEYIKDRLFNIQICYPKIKFIFNNESIKSGNINDVAKQFNESAVTLSDENTKIIFAPSGDDSEFKFVSYLNGLNLKNGGTHIDTIIGSLSNELRPMIKKKWKIEVVPSQIKQHLFFGIWTAGFVNPKFDSQSKERLTNTISEINSFYKDIDYVKLAKKIISTDDIINPMIEAILYKKEQAEKKAAKNALKNSSKIKSAKHVAATSKYFEEKDLTIGEGDSSLSSFIVARNADKNGSYALRGKILNTYNVKKEEIALNQELAELISIIGLNLYDKNINDQPSSLYLIKTKKDKEYLLGDDDEIIDKDDEIIKKEKLMLLSDSNIKKYYSQSGVIRKTGVSILNYGKIRIMTDMDYDGYAIQCLLLQFLSNWPDLFLQKRIYRLITPLYLAKKSGKETIYIYDFDEYEKIKDKLKGYTFKYIKGLGSLNVDDYREVVIKNPREVLITLDDNYLYSLKKAFSEDSKLRQEWLL